MVAQKKLNYQAKAAQALGPNKPLLAIWYGRGKTKILGMYLTAHPDIKKILVLTPKNNVHTWLDELKIVDPSLRTSRFEDETVVLEHDRQVWVADHKYIKRFIKKADVFAKLNRFRPDLIIIDESTVIKSAKSEIAQCAHQLRAMLGSVLYCVTGDPTPESPTEFWSQFEACMPGHNPLGKTYYQFLRRWFVRHDRGYTLMIDRRDEFYEIVDRHSVRMDEKDFEEYNLKIKPPKPRYSMAGFDLEESQLTLIKEMFTDWTLDGHEVNYATVMATKYQEICSGFYYQTEEGERRKIVEVSEAKERALATLILRLKKIGHKKMVVWYNFSAEQEMITRSMPEWNVIYFKITDEMDLNDFYTAPVSDEYIVVGIVPLSFSRGINDLVGASASVFYSNEYSNETRNQAELRFLRIGQEREFVDIIDLVSFSGKDREVAEMLQTKSLTNERLGMVMLSLAGELND